MKSTKITLSEWTYPKEVEDTIDIDWPRVQREIGEDCLRWLMDQPHDCCQLVLEKSEHHASLQSKRRLVAEFYDEKTAVSYHMMWAK